MVTVATGEIPEVLGAAIMVLGGYYGNGSERVTKLKADGYDASEVQDAVNKLIELFYD